MKIRNPVLLVILLIIAIGMINSLFGSKPEEVDPSILAKQYEEKIAFNKAHCSKNNLIYVESDYGKGECVTPEEFAKISAAAFQKAKERNKEKANEGLR